MGAGLPGNSPSAWVYGLSGLGQVRDPEEHCSFLRLTREENEPPDRPGAETSPWGAWQGRRWLVPAGGGGDSGPPGAAAGPQLLRANSCYLVPRAAHPGSSLLLVFRPGGCCPGAQPGSSSSPQVPARTACHAPSSAQARRGRCLHAALPPLPYPQTRCQGPSVMQPCPPPRTASLPPLPPMLGSGKVAKCHRGHWSNKSSLVQHLQGPGASPLLLLIPPTPAPSDKTPIVVGSEEDSFPLTKGL